MVVPHAPRTSRNFSLWGSWVVMFTVSLVSEIRAEFARDVLPILSEHCYACHGPDARDRKAGLRLDTFEGATRPLEGVESRAAIVPGDPQRSHLMERIHSGDPEERMPPLESGLELTAAQKTILQEWIASGAEYQRHWAFDPPQRPALPEGEHDSGNAIDAFIGERLRLEGLSFSPEARPERLIRRVSLDLTGLPPEPEDVERFVSDYRELGEPAYTALVDRLLASPRYGEAMALPWLDAARYADTDGYQFDGPRFMWRWRDWVIDAYNAKMPFDQFTIEQLAGDLLPGATLDQRIATGFNRNHRYNSEAGLVVEEFLLENAVDRVDTTSTLWMGLTMGCARCHDHKYDPLSQRDYYQLIAFFNSVPEAGRAIKSGNSEPVVIAPTDRQQRELDRLVAEVEKARASLPVKGESEDTGVLVDRGFKHRWLSEGLEFPGAAPHSIGELDAALRFRANDRFTVSFWLRLDDVGDGVILSRQQTGSTRPGIEVALVEHGRLQFDLITRWLAGVGRARTVEPLPRGQWMHVTLSNDGSQSANGQGIYVNGRAVLTEVSHNTNSNVGGVNAKRPLLLGSGVRPGARSFVGGLRDLRCYAERLWDEEIRWLSLEPGHPERRRFAHVRETDSFARYVAARERLENYRATLPTVMVMKDRANPKETFVRNRGVYDDFGERVERDVPAELPPLPDDAPRNRLGLARWLVSPEHPLTARVAVNRYWQKYFGTGLVKTAEDFGVRGERPSHPKLLDWLATEFVQSGWDVARVQRLIVSSRTYRQQSKVSSTLLARDPDNRWLARGPRLRLTGQAIRDQALSVSGLLSERVGGPSVSPYQPANLWAEMSMGMKYKPSHGADLYRRSLYTIWKRTVAPPAMAVFDSADREACWVGRKETNTPLQALTLLNETGFVESARHLAGRMLRAKAKGGDPVAYGFQRVTARLPSPPEAHVLRGALEEFRNDFQDDREAAEALLQVGESAVPPEVPVVELAAHTALANVLLNLDEVITKE